MENNNRFEEEFRKFMNGRYGPDQLGNTLLVLCFVLIVVTLIFKNNIFSIVGILLMILSYYRMFSKNFTRRYKENQKFMKIFSPLLNTFSKIKTKLYKFFGRKKDKNYKYFKCQKCKQVVRVPKGKGKVSIICPKCKNEFIKRT